MAQQLPSKEVGERLDLVESELRVALFFANFSSDSYSRGRLQHATDARSKAEHVCTRAEARLAAPEIAGPDARGVRSVLDEVQGALARLPALGEFKLRVRRAS
jgi:hypothetical protein